MIEISLNQDRDHCHMMPQRSLSPQLQHQDDCDSDARIHSSDHIAMPGALPVTHPLVSRQYHELPASTTWDEPVDLSYRAEPVKWLLPGSEASYELLASNPDQHVSGCTEEPAFGCQQSLASSKKDPMAPSSSEASSVARYDPKHIQKARSSRTTKADMRPRIVIAVFGLTGTGKSSFINKLTGQELKIGHDLRSCTSEIQQVHFRLGSHNVTLIDTPGFDDTHRQDTEVLREIASWMEHAYEEKSFLTGVIYLHRITDIRMSGTSLKNLRMLRSLCGTDTLGNVMLASTMWDRVVEAEGLKRERELLADSTFWGQLKEDGASIWRYNNMQADAIAMVEELVKRKPVVLQIQKELVVQKKALIDTSAGQSVNDILNGLEKKHAEEIEALKQEMARNGTKVSRQLQKELRELQEKINDVERSKRRLQMPITKRKWWQSSWRCAGCHARLTKDAGDPEEGTCPGCDKVQKFV